MWFQLSASSCFKPLMNQCFICCQEVTMSISKSNNNKLPSNLPQLQNLIKRDPESYGEEFDRQHAIYNATKDIFEQNPTLQNAALYELVMFFAQIAHCYTEKLSKFPEDLISILERHGSTLHPDMRLGFVKALILLRNKNLLSPTDLLKLFFRLLRSQDKTLRAFLKEHIIADIKNINTKGKNMKLNIKLQNFMFEMLKENHAVAIKTSLDVLIELYRKHVWNDAKTVNIISTACFHKITKVMVAAVKFFIGVDEGEEEKKDSSDSDSEDEVPSLKRIRMAARVNKTKRNNKFHRKEEKAKLAMAKKKIKKNRKEIFDFSAIHLIHDPQTLAERLYRKLEKMNERFEVKLMVMNLISRLVGIHQLYLPNFYPYLQRYLFVHQREVTKIMTFAAQASHSLVPPDDLEPVVRTLADNFVTERYSGEVMAMGINAIRELCARNPYCINEDLVQDLAAYKSCKDKSVMMAARSLIALFREKNPELLAKKDKGAPTELSKESKVKKFGALEAQEFIPGAEVLSFKTVEENRKYNREISSDEEWIDVSDDDERDSDDDEPKKANKIETPNIAGDSKLYTKKDAIKEVMKLTPQERGALALDALTTRALTDADFALIAEVQAAKHVERYSAGRKKAHKRKLEENEGENRGEIVNVKSIEMVYKKRRHDKEARIQTVLEGREGREKFGSRKGRMNPHASTTNREKIKAKSFMMMKHKIGAGKKKMNFREKQIHLRNALLKHKLK